MKHYLLNSFLLFSVASSSVALANALTCQPTYQGKPFVQVTIWSDLSGFGPAECDYKSPGDAALTVYKYPDHTEYYVVSGHWRSTMPGFQWCSVEDGNTSASCKFAQRIIE